MADHDYYSAMHESLNASTRLIDIALSHYAGNPRLPQAQQSGSESGAEAIAVDGFRTRGTGRRIRPVLLPRGRLSSVGRATVL